MKEMLGKTIAKIHRYWVKRESARFLQRHRRLRTLIAEIDRRSTSVGLSRYKYVSLYRMVRRTRPQYALECGTGKSTFVIALAMCQNGNGKRLVSLEESGDWSNMQEKAIDRMRSHAAAADWFPEAARRMIELVCSETAADRHRSWSGIRYANHRAYPYDFILVDGPALTDTRFINLDLVHVLKHFSDTVSIWIDGRWATAAMCRALFGAKTVNRPGWSHTEVYGAARADLSKDTAEIGREMMRMVK
jgi:hypothetical protein